MFTGIIEEIGKIISISDIPGGRRLKISARKILDDLNVDDSIAVNGICLTAVKVYENGFECEAVGVTLSKTTIKNSNVNDEVNLERAVKLSDRLGGHLVQGHINGVATVNNIIKMGDNYYLEIIIPDELKKYIINEGSIAADGISLTVAKIENNLCGISIIPHTWKNTTLKNKQSGSKINIETDVIAKYIENLIINSADNKDRFTDNWFKKLGY